MKAFKIIFQLRIIIIYNKEFLTWLEDHYRCTGSWGTQILNGTKKIKKVPVGGSASLGSCQLGKCQYGEVPVRGSASWGTSASLRTKFNPWTTIFFNFVGGKNVNPF